MRTQTKLIGIGTILIALLSSITLLAVLVDVQRPDIYDVSILPVAPQSGNRIEIVVYCIDPSGVSLAQLSWSKKGGAWQTQDMQFIACLCAAGGRWVGDFGPIYEGDTAEFYVTAFDSSVYRNSADTQVFTLGISS
ncbi:MAG: hypothetical protein JSW05_13455 [Candidatus Thorarchaeota archaeon]|nr:MAG: hypothetical protein JSW05_13455 [Candidatus Thorarchaeota archaeon]